MKTQTVITPAEAKKMNLLTATNIANDLQVIYKAGSTKMELVSLINAKLNGKEVIETPAAPTQEQAATTTPEAAKPAKTIIGTKIDIKEANEGDLIRYESSKKLYLVSNVVKADAEGKGGSRLLVSKTQVFTSAKRTFNVIRVMEASNTADYNKLVAEHFATSKNEASLDLLQQQAQAEVKAIAERAAKKAKNATATVTTPVAPIVEPVVAEVIAPVAAPAPKKKGNAKK